MECYFKRPRFSFSEREVGRFFREEGRTKVPLKRKPLHKTKQNKKKQTNQKNSSILDGWITSKQKSVQCCNRKLRFNYVALNDIYFDHPNSINNC